MTDQMSLVRAATFAEFAAKLRVFADRQEARAPGRMAHITEPALAAAVQADIVSLAYAAGDKETARSARAAYVALVSSHPALQGVA